MISTFGIGSLVVALVSVGALVLHYKVLQKRGAVDDAFAALDGCLRAQLEIICDAAENVPECDEIFAICENFAEYETRALFKALPKLRKSLPPCEKIDDAVSNAKLAAEFLNEKIDEYNAYSKTFPPCLMAKILGFSAEKKV